MLCFTNGLEQSEGFLHPPPLTIERRFLFVGLDQRIVHILTSSGRPMCRRPCWTRSRSCRHAPFPGIVESNPVFLSRPETAFPAVDHSGARFPRSAPFR